MMWINVFSIFFSILSRHSKSLGKEGCVVIFIFKPTCKINLYVLLSIRKGLSCWDLLLINVESILVLF